MRALVSGLEPLGDKLHNHLFELPVLLVREPRGPDRHGPVQMAHLGDEPEQRLQPRHDAVVVARLDAPEVSGVCDVPDGVKRDERRIEAEVQRVLARRVDLLEEVEYDLLDVSLVGFEC